MEITTSSSQSNERINVIKDNEILLAVAPWFGAKITALKLTLENRIVDVLWKTTEEDLEKNAWYKQSILFPYPNRLEDGKYSFDGNDYQFPINESDKNNQLHGMLYNVPFVLTQAEVIDDVATIELKYSDAGEKEYYPFAFDFTVVYEYSEKGLKTTFSVTNTGKRKMPFGIGWHPYFQFDNQPIAQTVFNSGSVEVIDLERNRSLPTGDRQLASALSFDLATKYLDDAFQLKDDRSYSLQLKGGPTLQFDCSEGFDYFQVFTPEGGESIAIEPMTCNINAFRNKEGLKILTPNETYTVSVDIGLS